MAMTTTSTGAGGDPFEFLESQAIVWKRDFDAILVGFVLGAAAACAVMGWW